MFINICPLTIMFIKLMVIFMIDSLKAGPGNVFPLAALCGFEAGAIALLHRLGAISWMQMPNRRARQP